MPSGVGVPQDEGSKYIATAEAPRHFCYHGPYSQTSHPDRGHRHETEHPKRKLNVLG